MLVSLVILLPSMGKWLHKDVHLMVTVNGLFAQPLQLYVVGPIKWAMGSWMSDSPSLEEGQRDFLLEAEIGRWSRKDWGLCSRQGNTTS